jgi:hypothetical protein
MLFPRVVPALPLTRGTTTHILSAPRIKTKHFNKYFLLKSIEACIKKYLSLHSNDYQYFNRNIISVFNSLNIII